MPLKADIYYRFSNEGGNQTPPIILVHGAGGTHLHWPSQVRRLSGYRVYAIDLPGHGNSEGRGSQAVETYCQSILQWMETIKISRGVIVGHSMGGAIALNFALQNPGRVVSLVLVGSGARLRVSPMILENSSSPTTFPIATKFIIDNSFSPHSDPRLKELTLRNLEKTRPSVLHGDFQACNEFDVMEKLSKVMHPSLVICGQDDQLTPVRYSQYLANQLPDAHLKLIPDAGHMVMLEKPNLVASELSKFLSSLNYSPGQ